jgi:hemerythrin
MPSFKWSKRYSVNNSELYEYNKALFDVINRLHGNYLVQNKVNCSGSLIDELVSYTNYHFSTEEQHIEEYWI